MLEKPRELIWEVPCHKIIRNQDLIKVEQKQTIHLIYTQLQLQLQLQV